MHPPRLDSDGASGSSKRCDVARPRTQSDVLRMLETESFHKENLSPFNPLPAIGQRTEDGRPGTQERRLVPVDALIFLNRRKHTATADPVSTLTLNEINTKNQKLNIMHRDDHDRMIVVDLLKEMKDHKINAIFRHGHFHAFNRRARPGVEDQRHAAADEESFRGGGRLERTIREEDEVEGVDGHVKRSPEKCATIIIGPKLFEKKRLLDKRERDFVPIVINREDKNVSLVPKNDSAREPTRPDPKVVDLIEILDNIQMSRKFKDNVKKPNYWF